MTAAEANLAATPGAGPGVVPPAGVHRGAARLVDSFAAMLRWHLVSLRLWLTVLAVVQVLSGVGFVLGISLFFDQMPASAALFVCTGVPVINLVLVGMILGPQLVAAHKAAGSYEFLQAMPVPRSVSAVAWYVVTLIGGLPAVGVSLLVAQLRYHLPLTLHWSFPAAVVLVSLTGTMLGYAVGHAVASPMAVRLITQVLVFAVFGFTPILFPASQMPGWLAAANWWLPFCHMATVMRAGLTNGLATGIPSSYVMLTVWALACTALTAWSLGRRP